MKKILTICLLVGALAHVSFSQDDAIKQREAREAAMKKAADADLPVIEDTNLNIGIASKKDKFSGGEPIQVDITLENNGASKTRLAMVPIENFYDIEVIGPYSVAAMRLPSSFRRYAGSDEGFNLSRTRIKSGSIILSNMFDMTLAGPYKIKVSKKFRLQDNKEPVIISSNTLNIEVTSAPPLSEWH